MPRSFFVTICVALSSLHSALVADNPPVISLWEKGAPGFESRKAGKEILDRESKETGECRTTGVHNPYVVERSLSVALRFRSVECQRIPCSIQGGECQEFVSVLMREGKVGSMKEGWHGVAAETRYRPSPRALCGRIGKVEITGFRPASVWDSLPNLAG